MLLDAFAETQRAIADLDTRLGQIESKLAP